MLAIIGFVVLVLLGCFLLFLSGLIFYGSALFGGVAWEFILPLVLAIIVFWIAFSYSPFTIAITTGG